MHFIRKVGTIIGSEDCILPMSPHKDRSKDVCVCVCGADSMWTNVHLWKAEVCSFCGSVHPAAAYKHKFFPLCCLISSSGDYYPSLFHSSGPVVAQLDEYLIWNAAFRQMWFVCETGFGLSGRRHLAKIQNNKLDVSIAIRKREEEAIRRQLVLTEILQLPPVQTGNEAVCHGACVGLCWQGLIWRLFLQKHGRRRLAIWRRLWRTGGLCGTACFRAGCRYRWMLPRILLTKMCPQMKEARKHKGGRRAANKRRQRHGKANGFLTVFVSIKLLIQTQGSEAGLNL